MINDARVIYMDNHLIAVNKLPSEIVQGDKTGDIPLSECVKQWLKLKFDKPGAVFLGVAHRIDRPVSGVVVFARTSKGLSRINELIRERKFHKIYWAVVKGKPLKQEGFLTDYLLKNERLNKSFIVDNDVNGALKSELRYRVLAESDKYSLVEVELFTGRHHQIRVQLANIGCPIKGDLKYGFPRSNSDGSISLHARNVSFIHPVTGENVSITADPPHDILWDYFMGVVGK